jgi:hypothetical protein
MEPHTIKRRTWREAPFYRQRWLEALFLATFNSGVGMPEPP